MGHAVRAAYMYAGMADVAALTGDSAYIHAIDRIWDNIVGKKYYITGGIGATSNGEAFGKNYELPNMSAYCETCAAIGNVYVNYRLFLLHGESKYYDVLERTLYNGLISGVSLDGGRLFSIPIRWKVSASISASLGSVVPAARQCLSFYPLFAGICLCGEGQGRVCESVYVQYFELEGRG